MKKFLQITLVVLILATVASISCKSQNFIGMHKDEIIAEMKVSHKNFKLNTGVINPHYKYLKYEDKINEITILFFLSDVEKCTLIRKMCDYSNINDVLAELNEKYNSEGNNKWSYKMDERIFDISMEEGEWFFTVTTQERRN
ncbi:MAG: hypothetical protein JW894_01655 [Bacteroidales bacterium]|nr:hypothetical protein [Bacteroidales bacterium]